MPSEYDALLEPPKNEYDALLGAAPPSPTPAGQIEPANIAMPDLSRFRRGIGDEIKPEDMPPASLLYNLGIPEPFTPNKEDSALKATAKAVGNLPVDVANFALSPAGLIAPEARFARKPLRALLGAAFAGQQVQQGLESDTLQGKIQSFLGAGLIGAGTLADALHPILGEPKAAPEVTPEIKPTEVPAETAPPITPEEIQATAAAADILPTAEQPITEPANASQIASPTGVPIPEVRQSVDETPPLRQQGEVAGAQIEPAQGERSQPPSPAETQVAPAPAADESASGTRAGEVKGAWYHASHNPLTELAPREVKNVDSLGTWVTNKADIAQTLYAPTVYEVGVPKEPRLLEFDGSDKSQIDFHRVLGANAEIAAQVGLKAEAKILSKTLPDQQRYRELFNKFEREGKNLTPAEHKEYTSLVKAREASKTLLRSPAYNKAFREMLEAQGFDGIIWKNSKIDLRQGDPSSHDVAVIFHKEPLTAKFKQRRAENAIGYGAQVIPDARTAGYPEPVVTNAETNPSPAGTGAATAPETGGQTLGKGVPETAPAQEPANVTRPLDSGAGEPAVTSTKNAVTAAEREARGLPEAEQAARRDFGTVWDQATEVATKDPTAPARLVDSLEAKPRALSDHENALLLRRQIEVQNEHDAAIQHQNDNPGNPDAQARLDAARNELQRVYDAGKAAGTETGRGLNARKMLAANDFSLSKMEAETRAVVNKGEPLSADQAAQIKALHERINAAESKLAGYEAQEQFRKELKAAQVAKQPRPEFLRQSYESAKARISNRRGRLYAGIDPTSLVDEAIVGAYHISRGVAKFADWSVEMVKEFGEAIKPHLESIFLKARALHSEATRGRQLTEEQRLAAAKTRTSSQTEIIKGKLETGDLSKTKRLAPVTPDKELTKLRFERDKAKDAYNQMLIEAQLKQRSVPRKILGGVGEVFNTTRALMTSFDLSAVLRQGGFQVFAHPVRSTKALPAMFKALASEKGQYEVNQEIQSRPNAPLYKSSKLYLAQEGPGVPLSKMEEAYMSRWAKRIPGVGASERAYTTFLNRIRADSFDALAATLTKYGKPTTEEANALSNYVNVTTGRGDLGKHATAATVLNKVFFAPRYVLSRFQLLAGQPLYRGTFRTRALIASEYARMLAGAATVYGLGLAAGGTVETDPRSSDFSKILFGNTRVDPLFGLAQVTTLLSRLGTGEKKTASGKIEPIRGPEVKYGGANSFDVTTAFLRSKLAPIPGAATNLLTGKDAVGQPVTVPSTATNLFQPISFGDIYKAMQEQGVPKGTAFGALSLFGMGLQTYQPKKNEERISRAAR